VFARRCFCVLNRPRPSCNITVPLASSAKVVTFGVFKCDVASFRVAGVALCDSATCFITCRKSFCVAGAILLQGFERQVAFFVAACHFGDCHRHCAWQAQHFRRVVLRVFVNRTVRAATSDVNMQIV
jgi:hypothetical protein